MRRFLETTFGPSELEIIDAVLNRWRAERKLPKENPDAELAAAVMINLFREGNDTVPKLTKAASEHKALSDFA